MSGGVLSVPGPDLPLGDGVVLLVRDACGLMAFAKPAGVLSHPNSRDDIERALVRAPYSLERECYEGASGGRLWLLNRLDSATSGVILAADSAALASAIREQFRRKTVRKIYNALVFGAPSVPAQVWRDRLAVDKRGGKIRTSGAGNIPCESRMQLLRRRRGQPLLSLIRLEPRTGRSHQLRVQCALHGLPIVGDATYGDFGANRTLAKATGQKRLFLHSLETAFDYEWDGRTHRFEAQAPLPGEFSALLEG